MSGPGNIYTEDTSMEIHKQYGRNTDEGTGKEEGNVTVILILQPWKVRLGEVSSRQWGSALKVNSAKFNFLNA